MNTLKLIFSSLTVAFAILGLTNALSFNISMPITFIFLGLSIFITSKEYKNKGDKKTSLTFFILGIFLYLITIYNIISTLIK